ncbi:DUF917 domain-containing protein [Mobilicoccus caccae]|uniref:DUF917 domain-containing protein n=1 Tax=Mobilicoccus caccae TaxID=1859295 RepID=A0ABQ6IMN0_9MICO|nr:DUF917 domain-containing protein [Mobilicoccus caccae]GMA39185.1 hypothetical protein GCM10025883_12300 [Mobilicoccus caccae]
MSWQLGIEELPALMAGSSLLGGGGGGDPAVLVPAVARGARWPVEVHDVTELDPATPCLSVGVGGSTVVTTERLPGLDPFGPAIAAVERWLGVPVRTVCSSEMAGLNGVTALPLAGERALVDADLLGRALPYLDQFSLFADGMAGLVAAASTGGDGVALVANARPEDVERLMRAAMVAAGGWSGVVIGGFTVGDLAGHAICGSMARALRLGRAWLQVDSVDPSAAEALGAAWLGSGRIVELWRDAGDLRTVSVDVRTEDGGVMRVVSRSEHLACVVDGEPVATAPDIIVVIDVVGRTPVAADELRPGLTVAVLRLPPPTWWGAREDRLARVRPSRYGVLGTEVGR